MDISRERLTIKPIALVHKVTSRCQSPGCGFQDDLEKKKKKSK